MKRIIAVYSPLCEATGAFLGQIKEWLEGTDVVIEECPYNRAVQIYPAMVSKKESCFIDIYYDGVCIDSVPLHRDRILAALGLEIHFNSSSMPEVSGKQFSEDEMKRFYADGKIKFIPITINTFEEELSMCLKHYPMGNPETKYHTRCKKIKNAVFDEVFQKETVAGIYAKMDDCVIGLLEVMPREIVKKYGFAYGNHESDQEVLTVACYEVAYGIPRLYMLDELMNHLLKISNQFHRAVLEGVGVCEWNEGFQPYWVYDKYGFHRCGEFGENHLIMQKRLNGKENS